MAGKCFAGAEWKTYGQLSGDRNESDFASALAPRGNDLLLIFPHRPLGTRSIDRPHSRCDHLQQMTIGIAEVKRLALILPTSFGLNRNALYGEPFFPRG